MYSRIPLIKKVFLKNFKNFEKKRRNIARFIEYNKEKSNLVFIKKIK